MRTNTHLSKISLVVIVLFVSSFPVVANITLPKIFASNMVLQRDKVVRIWGWSNKGESVTVSFNGQRVRTKGDKTGQWVVELKPMTMSGAGLAMTIEGKNKISLSNILLGDVYICSGQSNMEWVIKNTNHAAEEIAAANYPGIRFFTVPKATAFSPANDLPGGEWQECNPGTVGDFSAVAYFFGRKLYKDIGVPIGLIHSSWGGTNVQAWISWDSMGQREPYKSVDFSKIEKDKEGMEQRMNQFRESLKNDKGTKEKWFEPTPITNDWKPIQMPRIWEETEIGNGDGVVWFRRDIDVPASLAGKAATLRLGPIDDYDVTYVNGMLVGGMNAYNDDRVYQLKAGILKAGKNTIVVKVTDTGGGGGIYGADSQLSLQVDGEQLPLAGPWFYREAALSTTYNVQNYGPNDFPSQLYNAMIAPIIRYSLKGGIWYQGEANAGESYKYRTLFPEMINDWRSKWKDDFPFFWVQLANFMKPDSIPVESGWAELREAQNMTLSLPKTGQAVIIDIGEEKDIHPRNKQDVGYRLALAAEKVAYDKDIVFSGPVYRSMEIKGDKIILSFSSTGSGLWGKDKYGYLKGFSIAGADKKFKWAKATIDGDKVTVYSEEVVNPVAVRYAWADNPDDANLYNKEGLPASPFRTDDWPGKTVGKSDYK